LLLSRCSRAALSADPILSCRLDSYSSPTSVSGSGTYQLSEKNIIWANEAKKYAYPPGYDSPSDVVPPPNWAEKYPNGYTEFPNFKEDEHFQVWMRIAGLPTFKKLWGRNDNDVFTAGRYRIQAYMSQSSLALLAYVDGPVRWLTSQYLLLCQTTRSSHSRVQSRSCSRRLLGSEVEDPSSDGRTLDSPPSACLLESQDWQDISCTLGPFSFVHASLLSRVLLIPVTPSVLQTAGRHVAAQLEPAEAGW
jgi:hypothetical protein